MEIMQKVEATVSVVVRMEEDGTLSGRLIGHMPYADVKEIPKRKGEEGETTDEETPKAVYVPGVSADVPFSDEDLVEVGKVLAVIVEKHGEVLARRLGDARAEARLTARKMGELI